MIFLYLPTKLAIETHTQTFYLNSDLLWQPTVILRPKITEGLRDAFTDYFEVP